jgi:hypothetical protein
VRENGGVPPPVMKDIRAQARELVDHTPLLTPDQVVRLGRLCGKGLRGGAG